MNRYSKSHRTSVRSKHPSVARPHGRKLGSADSPRGRLARNSGSNVLTLPSLAVLCATAGGARAGDEGVIQDLTSGTDIPGVGVLETVDQIQPNTTVTGSGDVYGAWFVEGQSSSSDQVLLRNGALVLQEGQTLPAPPGATVDFIGPVTPNESGDVSYVVALDDVPGVGSALYVNQQLVFVSGDPLPGLPSGTTVFNVFDARLNDSDQILLSCAVTDPATQSPWDRWLVRCDLDEGLAATGTTVIAKDGQPTGFGGTLAEIDEALAFNNEGSAIWSGSLSAPPNADGFIAVDSSLLAIEGSPSPVAGRSWSSFEFARVDLNNHGSVIYSGQLDGDSTSALLIVKDGEKFVQTGDDVPGMPGTPLTAVASGFINDLDEVLWYGQWTDPVAGSMQGVFLDDELLLQSGEELGGVPIEAILFNPLQQSMSADGSQIVLTVRYADGSGGLFSDGSTGLVRIIRKGDVTTLVGCTPSGASLEVTTGAPNVGATTTLVADASPFPNALTTLLYSLGQFPSGSDCGLFVPGLGELLLDPGLPNGGVPMPPWVGSPVELDIDWPNNSALVGAEIFIQALFVDATLSNPAPTQLTNAAALCIGA